MPKQSWVWVVGFVLVVSAAIVINGYMSSDAAQTAAAGNSSSDVALNDASFKQDIAKIDAQIGKVAANLKDLNTNTTRIQVSVTAKSIFVANSMIGKLLTKLQSRSTNSKTAGGASLDAKVLADIASNLSNATSAAGVADKNSSAAVNNAAAQQQALSQLVTSFADLQAARSDITTLLAQLGIK